MCPDEILIYMGNGRQPHTKTSAAEQRVPTNYRQHSPKVDTVTCNKINSLSVFDEIRSRSLNIVYRYLSNDSNLIRFLYVYLVTSRIRAMVIHVLSKMLSYACNGIAVT